MIAAWMLYTLAVTALLLAGASGAEYVARAIRLPARVVWAAAMLAALGLSGRALTRGPESRPQVHAPSIIPMTASSVRSADSVARPSNQASVQVAPSSGVHNLLIAARETSAGFSRMVGRLDAARLDVARFTRWNGALIAFCVATSGLALIWLIGSFRNLRRVERGLAFEVVDDHVVLISENVGPALFGVLRSRIVLPRWVLSLPQPERHIILTHEEQHAHALDPALLCSAAIALALQPWNVALWALFVRMRFALETDCDGRVLGAIGDARRYGKLLIAVYERTTPMLAPSVAFVARPSDLERRIRRMTRRPRPVSVAVAMAAVLTLVLSTAAWTIAAPVRWAAGETVVESRAQLLPAITALARGVTRASALQSRIGAIRITGAAPHETIPPLGLTPSVVMPTAEVQQPPSPLMSVVPEEPCQRRIDRRPDVSMRMIGDGLTVKPACTIDGDIVMVALDSARVLVAWRSTAEAALQNVEYLVFTTEPGSVPSSLTWSTTAGHADFRGSIFHFASPAPGIPSATFGPSGAALQDIDPTALRFVVRGFEILRQPAIPWDVLRQLPTAPRCTSPLIIIDGVVSNEARATQAAQTRDCFVVGGQEIRPVR